MHFWSLRALLIQKCQRHNRYCYTANFSPHINKILQWDVCLYSQKGAGSSTKRGSVSRFQQPKRDSINQRGGPPLGTIAMNLAECLFHEFFKSNFGVFLPLGPGMLLPFSEPPPSTLLPKREGRQENTEP